VLLVGRALVDLLWSLLWVFAAAREIQRVKEVMACQAQKEATDLKKR
jgi:hypothetical protein